MIRASFAIFMRQIFRDRMLVMVLFAPFIAGAAFRFGLPAADTLILTLTGFGPVFAPWQVLIDLFLAVLTPYLFCFASAMVMLEERDEGTATYLMVTPVSRTGYFVSRLLVPALLSMPITALVLILFGQAGFSALLIAALSLASALVAVLVVLLILAFAGNKVEGMALAKLAGLYLAGLPLAFFPDLPFAFLHRLLPSWWIARLAIDTQWQSILGFLVCSTLWATALLPFFMKKNGR